MFEEVRKRLDVAGKQSAHKYNLRKRQVDYVPEQLVWKRNHVLSDASRYFSKKLAPRYVGPYKIHKKVSPWTYRLKEIDVRLLEGTWNANDLKPDATGEN